MSNLKLGRQMKDISIARSDDETVVTRPQQALALLDDCANTLEWGVENGDFSAIEDIIDDIRTARQWLVEELYPEDVIS